MRTKSPNLIPTPLRPETDEHELAAPHWATVMLDGAERRLVRDDGRLMLQVSHTPEFSLVTARVAAIDFLPPAQVEQATADAYAAIAGQLGQLPAKHPVRFWNYIPAIHQPSG